MDTLQKMALCAQEMELEVAEEATARGGGCSPAAAPPPVPVGSGREIPLHMAALPGGRRIALLKGMLTTACERDCLYCSFRAGRSFRRVTFRPEEFAATFITLHRARRVQGLFLSTGVFSGGANTQNKLLDVAEILRNRLGYRGYLHLKLMPGVERGQVLRAMQLADRVSINLEAPSAARLRRLAPSKRFDEELLRPLQWVHEIRRDLSPHRAWDRRWPSSTTQFVVGAAGEKDLEILSTANLLMRRLGLARAYFKAFTPVPDTPLDDHPPEHPLRQHRLYQASFLLRDYGFDLEELPFDSRGQLPLHADPKLAYAQAALAGKPVEVNMADRELLLRVPGVGPRGAEAILHARRQRTLRDLRQLRKLGVLAERAAPYITLDGRRPARQLPLL